MTEWKHFPKDRPEDDRNYFVSWKNAIGRYTHPHLTFYSAEEDKFFSLQVMSEIPMMVDIFIEVPALPGLEEP